MIRPGLRFPLRAKLVLYGNLALSLLSGVAWFVLDRWFQVEGEFGPEKHPLQTWLIRLHGASAFLVLVGIGIVLGSHVPVAWRTRRHRRSGLVLLGSVGGLALTGYLLYYAPGPDFRQGVAWSHLGLGLALPVWVVAHVWRRKR